MTKAQNRNSRPASETTTLRSRFTRVLAVILWVLLATILISLIVQFNPNALLRFTPVIALVGYGLWILLWSPSVTIAPSGVEVRNLLRTNAVSWPAIQRIDTRYALTLFTTAGKIVAWSAPAPSRFAALRLTRSEVSNLPESSYAAGSIRPGDIPMSDSGLVALYVRRYYERLRDAGHLDSGVVEGTGVVTKWLVPESLTLVGLLLLSLATNAFVR